MSWHKYNAVRTTVDGITFPSKLEADTFGMLKLLQSQGLVSNIDLQVTVRLTKAELPFRIDFRVFHTELDQFVFYESKGLKSERFRILEKLWVYYGPAPLFLVTSIKAFPTRPYIIPQ